MGVHISGNLTKFEKRHICVQKYKDKLFIPTSRTAGFSCCCKDVNFSPTIRKNVWTADI
jgi:hypothetical protein